eukprot:sb/3468198/
MRFVYYLFVLICILISGASQEEVDWISKTPKEGLALEVDLENTELYIKTGSGERIEVSMYKSDATFGSFGITSYETTLYYFINPCTDNWSEFATQPAFPEDKIMVWIISKTESTFSIRCNGELLLVYTFEDANGGETCVSQLSGDVIERIKFTVKDASKWYAVNRPPTTIAILNVIGTTYIGTPHPNSRHSQRQNDSSPNQTQLSRHSQRQNITLFQNKPNSRLSLRQNVTLFQTQKLTGQKACVRVPQYRPQTVATPFCRTAEFGTL